MENILLQMEKVQILLGEVILVKEGEKLAIQFNIGEISVPSHHYSKIQIYVFH